MELRSSDRKAERQRRDQERVSNSLSSTELERQLPTKTPTSNQNSNIPNQEIYYLEGKVCSTCYKFKYLYDYYRESKSPDGFKAKCKKCLYTVKRKHYEKNKEKYKECYKRFLEKNPNYQSNYYFLKIKKKNIN